MTTSASMLTPTALWSYHGPPDVGQPALGFVLCKLQTADVLQTSLVLAHLLVDDQLHTPAEKTNGPREPFKLEANRAEMLWYPMIDLDTLG